MIEKLFPVLSFFNNDEKVYSTRFLLRLERHV